VKHIILKQQSSATLQILKKLWRDAMQSTVMPQYVVCLSVTFRYRDHIGWKTSKIISLLISLSFTVTLMLTPTWVIWSHRRMS